MPLMFAGNSGPGEDDEALMTVRAMVVPVPVLAAVGVVVVAAYVWLT